MKTSCVSLPRLLLLLAALLFAGASDAHAKRVPKLFTFGDDFYDLGEIKVKDAEPADVASLSGVKVGYHCQAFGLFWVNIFTWSGEFCLYKGSGLETKQYEPISQEDAAKFLGVAKVGKPWNYSFPPGMLAVIGLIGLKIIPRFLAKKKAAAAAQTWQGSAPAQPRWTPPPAQTPQPPEAYAPPQTVPPPVPDAVPPPMPPDERYKI